jgi:hypothetical protein
MEGEVRMVQKRCLVLIFLLMYTILLSGVIHAASYQPGSYSDLTITANSDFTGGTYTINGNLTVNSGITLMIKGVTTVNVSGNIVINGTISTSNISTSAYLVKLSSTYGNISINNTITIYGTAGANGTAGAQTKSGTAGAPGGTVDLEMVAVKGDVIINGQVTNNGGAGGTGGNGGGSVGNWFTGTNGGTGGVGGVGATGGQVKIVANAGKVTVNKPILSLGGSGGKGGTGGPDQSVAGGPGVGGKGGKGGNGGSVIIVGQDVVLASNISLNVSPGTPGSGGAGGSAGSSGNLGPTGAVGEAGTPGAATVVGGEIYKGTVLISSSAALTLIPSNAQKTLLYDSLSPVEPLDVKLPYYKNVSGVYFTNSTNVIIKVKLPQDRGILYEGVTYRSDIANC